MTRTQSRQPQRKGNILLRHGWKLSGRLPF